MHRGRLRLDRSCGEIESSVNKKETKKTYIAFQNILLTFTISSNLDKAWESKMKKDISLKIFALPHRSSVHTVKPILFKLFFQELKTNSSPINPLLLH